MLYLDPLCFSFQPVTTKTDTYAWGITLWEIFAQSVAYADKIGSDFFRSIRFHVKQGTRPTELARVPPDAKALMEECWDADPDVRPEFRDMAPRVEAWDTSSWPDLKPFMLDQVISAVFLARACASACASASTTSRSRAHQPNRHTVPFCRCSIRNVTV